MAKREHLIGSRPDVEVVETPRGGDVTYHGPGQIVGYPILDLTALHQDLKKYLGKLEEVMIRAVGRYGVQAGRQEGMTGAWVGDRKIGAIGVRVEKWVTSHGFALNANNDLDGFDLIIPCGLRGKGVTSIAREIGHEVDLDELRRSVVEIFGEVAGRRMIHEGD
jgi:lipoate-protein ligase B